MRGGHNINALVWGEGRPHNPAVYIDTSMHWHSWVGSAVPWQHSSWNGADEKQVDQFCHIKQEEL
jgi:hypothetical protein